VVDAGPAPQDAYAPPDASAPDASTPIDVAPPDVATAPDVLSAPDVATTPDVTAVPDVAVHPDVMSAPDLGPPPPLPPAKPVSLVLDTEKTYFLYAYGGGAGCNTTAGPPYLVEITSGTVCVPESAGKLVSMPLNEIRTCNGDTGCVDCGSDPACQPTTCFAPLPPTAPGTACSHTLKPIAGNAVTRYMLFPQKPESSGAEEEEPEVKQGLPKVWNASDSEVTITPPPEYATFVMGRLDKPVNITPPPPLGDCDGNGLCTILPLTFTPSGSGALWDFWPSTTLFWAWSLF
jgi:hypothetical protein